jgi:hypothetical protein
VKLPRPTHPKRQEPAARQGDNEVDLAKRESALALTAGERAGEELVEAGLVDAMKGRIKRKAVIREFHEAGVDSRVFGTQTVTHG